MHRRAYLLSEKVPSLILKSGYGCVQNWKPNNANFALQTFCVLLVFTLDVKRLNAAYCSFPKRTVDVSYLFWAYQS